MKTCRPPQSNSRPTRLHVGDPTHFFFSGSSHVSAAWNLFLRDYLPEKKNELNMPRMFFVPDVSTLRVCVKKKKRKKHESAQCNIK